MQYKYWWVMLCYDCKANGVSNIDGDWSNETDDGGSECTSHSRR